MGGKVQKNSDIIGNKKMKEMEKKGLDKKGGIRYNIKCCRESGGERSLRTI